MSEAPYEIPDWQRAEIEELKAGGDPGQVIVPSVFVPPEPPAPAEPDAAA